MEIEVWAISKSNQHAPLIYLAVDHCVNFAETSTFITPKTNLIIPYQTYAIIRHFRHTTLIYYAISVMIGSSGKFLSFGVM